MCGSPRSVVAWVSLTAIILLNVSDALACRCKEPGLDIAYKHADAIVQCEVVEIVRASEGSGSTAVLKVSQAWKDAVPEKITVATSTSCAYPWNEGEKHLIFLTQQCRLLFDRAMLGKPTNCRR